jgi:hypothetical protein
MTDRTEKDDVDPELDAMRTVYGVLRGLDAAAQQRVIDYVTRRLELTPTQRSGETPGSSFSPRDLALETREQPPLVQNDAESDDDDELAGVSPVAKKWVVRNSLTAKQLSSVFSLGADEIDLVARSIPGKSKREKHKNVLLLAGVASYLSGGSARVDDARLREALGHYNAYDQANFAKYMKEFAPDVSGTRENGYTLTARGLAAAADVIREMTGSAS